MKSPLPTNTIKREDIKKGLRFNWNALSSEYRGIYEIVVFRKDLLKILCYKPYGWRKTLDEERLAKFDKRIIDNPDFLKCL